MNKKKIVVILLIIIFGILSTIVYFLIDDFNLGNDLGVILGFLLATILTFFVLSLDLLLGKKKIINNEKCPKFFYGNCPIIKQEKDNNEGKE